jgi:hypothetical protein
VLLEFIGRERPVVERRGQPEAVLDQRSLRERSPPYMPPTCGIETCDSSTNSSQSLGKKSSRQNGVEPGFAAGEVARVVLDAVAVADLAQHVEVVARALFEPLRFEQLAVVFEERQPVSTSSSSIASIARRSFSSGVM